jgi:hypothetical protein
MLEPPASLSSEPLAEGNAPSVAALIHSARWSYILSEGGSVQRLSKDHDAFGGSVYV